MNKKQQQQFVAFFQQIYQGEQQFERIKKRLRSCKQFSASMLFNYIAGDNDKIQISRMKQYLNNKIACNERQLYQVFQKMDITRQGFISKDDFVREISPVDQRVEPGHEYGKVTAEIQAIFIQLIAEYIQRLRVLQVARKEIYHILPYNAFAQIDTYKTGLIGLEELRQYFKRNDYGINDLKLILLIHGLRRRCYLEINLEVFCENLEPLEFGHYQEYRKNMERIKQEEELQKQRNEQQLIKRSRIQSKKLQYTKAKEQRRKKADLERELQLEQRIHEQIKQNERNRQKLKRRDVLFEDKNTRWNMETGNSLLDLQKQKYLAQKIRNQKLFIIKNQQNQIQDTLIRTAIKRQEQLENSKRIRQNLQRQAELQRQINLEKQKVRIEFQLKRERALMEEMWRENDLKEQERRIQSQRQLWQSQMNRRAYEDQLIRQRIQMQYQLQRIRNNQLAASRPIYDEMADSRRIIELQRELELTRLEMRDKLNKGNFSHAKKLEDTAEKSHSKYRV